MDDNLTKNLPRVKWQYGQTLLPKDFVAQENSLLADTALQLRTLGLPFYGLIELKWDENSLTKGTVAITKLTCIFLQTGYFVQIGTNAVWENNISSLQMSNSDTAVYLHLMNKRVTKEDCSCVSSDSQIEKEYYVVKISNEKSDACAIDTLKLAVFVKGMTQWQRSADYIPPLLSANPNDTPFLTSIFNDLQDRLRDYQPILQQIMVASYVTGERKFATQQFWFSMIKFENYLQNLQSQIHNHPYYFYEMLISFYLSLFLYLQRNKLEAMTQLYNHNDLAQTLMTFVTPILNNLNPDYPVVPVYEEFVLKKGVYQIAPLPQQVQCAKQIFLLIQKENANTSLCLNTFKIASLEDLPNVVRYSTTGIPLKKIVPPFINPFGSEVDFYLLETSTELQNALRDNSLGFYESDQPQGMKSAALYWR